MKKIVLRENKNENLAKDIASNLNLDLDMVQYLVNCGMGEEEIKYLTTEKYIDIDIKIANLNKGVRKLMDYLAEDNLTIYIRSDYDSDGMNAAYIAKSILDIVGELLELNLTTVILDVDRSDKYGINKKDCLKIINDKSENKLVMILDNGITKASCTDYLYKYDIESIIIDHHMPRETKDVPNNGSIVIDPFFNDTKNEEAKGLCGAALTYFFFRQLIKELGDTSDFIENYTANAAIATITDCMPNTKTNISLVANGMKRINNKESSPAINYYAVNTGKIKLIPKDVAFELGPQLNACGRMHDVKLAIDYLFEEDNWKIDELYSSIKSLNEKRKNIEKSTMKVIDNYIDASDKVIMAILEDNNDGILGSLAGKLMAKYNKPVILFCRESDGLLSGSARSISPVNLHELFTQDKVKDYIKSFGGHAQAAGISIEEKDFNNLKEALNETIRKNKHLDLEEINKNKIVEVDKIVDLSYINQSNLHKQQNIVFFNDLKEPILLIPNVKINSTRTSTNPENICLNMTDDSVKLNCYKKGKEIWIWGFTSNYEKMGSPENVHLIGRLSSMFSGPTLDVIEMLDADKVKIL